MSWKDILKEWKPKKLPPKPKQIDVVLDYLSRNTDGATVTNMVKDLNLHIRPARLKKVLEEHPKVDYRWEYTSISSRRKLYFIK